MLKLFIILIIGVAGIFLILKSSTLSVNRPSDRHEFNIHLYPKEGRLNKFVIFHDFVEQQGNISFVYMGDKSPSNIQITLFSSVDPTSVKIRILEEEMGEYKELSTTGLNISLSGNEQATSILLENRGNVDLKDKLIVIEFKSNFEPNGVFIIDHSEADIGLFYNYGIHFHLGEQYLCERSCIDRDYNDGINEIPESTNADVKLQILTYDDTKKRHVFKMTTQNKAALFLVNLLFGVGISLFASFPILLFEHLFERLK